MNQYIMRMPEVEKAVGYKNSSIRNFIKDGTFPKPVKIGKRALGWSSLEIQRWIDLRLG